MTVSLDAIRLAQRSGQAPVRTPEGLYVGIVYGSGWWECAECLTDGVGGRSHLLAHDAEEHA